MLNVTPFYRRQGKTAEEYLEQDIKKGQAKGMEGYVERDRAVWMGKGVEIIGLGREVVKGQIAAFEENVKGGH